MSPLLMLSLWRERWGKADSTVLTLPYLDGPVNRWSIKLMDAKIWLLPGFPVATVLICILSLAVVVSIELTLNSQIVFATVIICVSLYAKRYRGHWVTLVLVGFAFIVSARYFFWRLDATLSNYFDFAFIAGFILIVAELYIWLLSIVNGLAEDYPLKRSSKPMAEDEKNWPTVDIFILCHGQSVAKIERAARMALSIVWPKEKIKIHLIDNSC
ncbi:MAG: hypothetical protein U1D25_18345 [Hydrogenophaga sp.]|uniref:hypothetical protein n=1 Tax=Hydrogenophaga sp. TaxID=1904254 RepID=UPI002AB950E4|nr:hypothetical protein [Hydrogenophaga sp.]MDZ4190046.1 hypothetical protein [Hydrogenophaga sp.]